VRVSIPSSRLGKAAVDQISATLVGQLHGKELPGAIAQLALQPCAVSGGNAGEGIKRKITVLLRQHVLDVRVDASLSIMSR